MKNPKTPNPYGYNGRTAVLSRDWDNPPDEFERASHAIERHRARCGEDTGFDAADLRPADFF